LKGQFWEELRNISVVRDATWLLCGDFNAIRFKYEKLGPNFHIRASARFNTFLDDYNLIEYESSNRRFTWSNERQFALIDRFLCSIQWDTMYQNSIVRDLAKYGSDHCPLVLQTNTANLKAGYIFRCDKAWFDIPKFNELVLKWWLEFKLSGD
jgi:endonuclease/exonuclease/phosphatase family metal-dependent hydrolase